MPYCPYYPSVRIKRDLRKRKKKRHNRGLDVMWLKQSAGLLKVSQGPGEMCFSLEHGLEHQNLSKTSEKMDYFDRVTVRYSFVTHSTDRKPRD